ncbi:MAG: hypothetical protein IT572_00450 [Deltaproteobacteria bacterium]|nr:hypothetical protein [Deltaproteobacteria bacterium]
MPIDFDPVFHTETMVKILREQGSTQYAMELAELILQKNPQHEGVRRILEELREEARRAFERFKSGGRGPETSASSEPESEEAAVDTEAAGRGPENTSEENPLDLQEVSSPAADRHAVGVAAPADACESLDAGPELRDEALSRPLREEGLEFSPAAARQTVEAAASPATAFGSEPVRLTLVPPPPPPTRREVKILRLQALLRRVQSLRKAAHAPQA